MSKLDDLLKFQAEKTDSMFQAVLAREDLDRISRLRGIAAGSGDRDQFVKDGIFIGWTKNDMRTGELKPLLEPLLKAFWAVEREQGDESMLLDAWKAFHKERLRILVHCLSR